MILLNGGRPKAALAGGVSGYADNDARAIPRYRIMESIFWDGDSAAANQAARVLAPHADGPIEREAARSAQYRDICTVELWRLYLGYTKTAAGAIRKLRAAQPPREICAGTLDAWLAAETRSPDAGPKLEHLDSLLQRDGANVMNLVVARLREGRGDPAGALRAVRRGAEWFMLWPAYRSTFLREEGRLAAITGDTVGAIKAYQDYLALRHDPEPSLRAQRDSVRMSLSRLLGEPRDR